LSAPPLPKPTALFASAPASHQEIAAGKAGSKSRRPLETISPLAEKLGMTVDLRFSKGQEADLATAISAIDGVVLVCWQHENIFAIASSLSPTPAGVPADWPGKRFNVIFRFDRPDAASAWSFQQLAPRMLDGDETELI
jgi:hypothetical protein